MSPASGAGARYSSAGSVNPWMAKMTDTRRFQSSPLVLGVVLAVAVFALASPAIAQGLTGVVIDFPDSVVVDVADSAGIVVAQGEHTGTVRCYDGNCGQRTQLHVTSATTDYTIEYKFKDLLVLDSDLERAVISGTGVISSADDKGKFDFVATFESHANGSVTASYSASRVDASFIVTAPGTLTLVEKP